MKFEAHHTIEALWWLKQASKSMSKVVVEEFWKQMAELRKKMYVLGASSTNWCEKRSHTWNLPRTYWQLSQKVKNTRWKTTNRCSLCQEAVANMWDWEGSMFTLWWLDIDFKGFEFWLLQNLWLYFAILTRATMSNFLVSIKWLFRIMVVDFLAFWSPKSIRVRCLWLRLLCVIFGTFCD